MVFALQKVGGYDTVSVVLSVPGQMRQLQQDIQLCRNAVDRPKNLCVIAGSLTVTAGTAVTSAPLVPLVMVVIVVDAAARSRPSSRSLVCQA